MKNKIKQFLQSYLGHVVFAFILCFLFIFSVLFIIDKSFEKQEILDSAYNVRANIAGIISPDIDNRAIKIALIVSELGLSQQDTKKAIETLPAAVSLAFSPYTEKLNYWFSEGKKFGHEILLEIPMEPINYPDDDSGPLSLLTRYSNLRNIELLKDIMEKSYGYSGIINWMGDGFMQSRESLFPVFDYIKQKTDLFFIDSLVDGYKNTKKIAEELKLPYANVNIKIDRIATKNDIIASLEKLEIMAKIGSGYSIGIMQPYPVSIDTVKEWSNSLKDKNITLISVSEIF